MQTQRALELEMVRIGKENADRVYALAEEKGRASSNPYASAIHRRFVEPLAKVLEIKYIKAPKTPGRKPKIQALLEGQDPLVVSYLSIRTILNRLIPTPDSPGTWLGVKIGTALYGEVLLRTFEDINPALFHVLTRDLKRRMSKDERHRINVFRHEAERHGIPFAEWDKADRALVGTAILREMVELDLLVVGKRAEKGKTVNYYDMHPKIRGLLEGIKDFVSLTQPVTVPCIEPPKPWVTPNDGGWHTQEMRRTAPSCIASSSFVEDGDVPDNVLEALNRMQSVEWRINKSLLSAVQNVSRHFDVGDVISQAELPKPQPPIWLRDGMTKDDMDEFESKEFLSWKRDMSEWYTENRARNTKWGRFYESMRVANQMKEQDKLWFVWQADYRSRFYAKSRGVTPQGSDLQKALIEFKKGGLISSSPESEFWFKVNGANRFGYDSAELEDRVKWVDERKQFIIDIANDPISFREWTEADKPFQFLAWCFEYAAWQAFPDQARTHLPVGLDGSCNGLQHLSAMTRDPVGGEATNLMPGTRKDIYALVAIRLTEILRGMEEEPWRDAWLKHGITRKLTKRSVDIGRR